MSYIPKKEPWAHQKKALELMEGLDAFGLLMSMRTGKTKTVLDDFGRLWASGQVDDLLVIAPAGVYRTWETAIKEHVGEPLVKNLLVKTWSSGENQSQDNKAKWKWFMKPSALAWRHEDITPRVLLMNVEALSSVKKAKDLVTEFCNQRRAYAVVDECFPKGSMVSVPGGGKAIEELKSGEEVWSSNGIVTINKVLKKEAQILIKVSLSDGKVIRATPNHPIFTDLGWMCIGNLQLGDFVHDRSSLRNLWKDVQGLQNKEILRDILLSEMENDSTRDQIQDLQRRGSNQEGQNFQGQRALERETFLEQGNPYEGRGPSKVEQISQRDGASPSYSRREWEAFTRGSSEASGGIRMALDLGTSHRIGREAVRLSNLLQSGLGQSRKETGHRVRWIQPFISSSQGEGQEEGNQITRTWVESIEVEEFSSPVNVYDLELCGTPHFFVENVLVHNSTSIKNPKSKRTKFILELARYCKYRRILTGLVSPKEPSDVWSQFEFLRPGCLGFSNFYSFQARYAITKIGYGKGSKPGTTQNFIKIIGWRDQEELRERISRHSFRVKLSDCYDLPPKIYQVREVELTDEQERVYGELQRYATAKLKEDVYITALQACTLALRLHQICCGHVGDEEGNRREVESNRVKELLNLLEEWDDGESKAIIWCAYDRDVKNVVTALQDKFGPGSVARFWGGNRATREMEEKSFKEASSCRFMVATASAGGRGRTWDVADLVVYFSNNQDLEHREQSEERPQAVGRTKSILYVDIMSVHKDGSHTIDYAYLESLRRKISMAALLQGDGFRHWVI